MARGAPSDPPADERILDAAVAVLARDGVAGVSMRAVAREAGVALGLANYHFEGKTALISAALERVGARDMELVRPPHGMEPVDALRLALERALDTASFDRAYLSLRLQLWSLAGVDEAYAAINRTAQRRYLDGLAALIAAARPELARDAVERRAADILIEQHGVWLTAMLVPDDGAVTRALARCERLALE